MRKVILTLVAIILSLFLASAQLKFGVKAGYNSSLNIDNLTSLLSGTYNLTNVKSELGNGFHAGVFARIGKKIYVQPELLYALQKKDYTITLQDVSNSTVTVDKFLTTSTIDVPVLLGYSLVNSEVLKLRVFAGPKFRLNAGSQLEFANVSNVDIEQLKGDFKKSTVSLEAGVGFDILFLTVDARLNLFDNFYIPKWDDSKLRSNLILSAGIKF